MTSPRKGSKAADRARAEGVFQRKEEQRRVDQSAVDEYRAMEAADRAKTAKLRELRLAAETKASVKPETKQTKRKPAGKGK